MNLRMWNAYGDRQKRLERGINSGIGSLISEWRQVGSDVLFSSQY